MSEEQQNQCVALILAIAFSSNDAIGLIPATAKRFLSTLPPEIVAKAAGTPIDFSKFGQPEVKT